VCGGWGSVASAAPVATKALSDFSYVWNFEGATTAENYDRYNSTTGAAGADGTNEWNTTVTPTAGTISVTDTSYTNTFWTTAAAAAAQITTSTGYTVEWRVKMTTTDQLLLESTLPSTTAAATGKVNGANLDIYFDLASTAGGVRATVPASDFFTVRIAATPDAAKAGGLAYTLYVNDALAGDNIDAERTSIVSRRFFVGDTGGVTSGTMTVDYAGFTPGAFAPVSAPEPSSTLLVIGGIALAARRRRPARKV
jgi:hypothetical protein